MKPKELIKRLKRGERFELAEPPASPRGEAGLGTGHLYRKAIELRMCAKLWEPDAMLVGNVRASEIEAIMTDYLRLRLKAGIGWPNEQTQELAEDKMKDGWYSDKCKDNRS